MQHLTADTVYVLHRQQHRAEVRRGPQVWVICMSHTSLPFADPHDQDAVAAASISSGLRATGFAVPSHCQEHHVVLRQTLLFNVITRLGPPARPSPHDRRASP